MTRRLRGPNGMAKVGDKFNDWTIMSEPQPIDREGKDGKIITRWKVLCQCKCGKQNMIEIASVTSGRSTKCQSCGQKESNKSMKFGAFGEVKTIRGWLADPRCTSETYGQLSGRIRHRNGGLTMEEIITMGTKATPAIAEEEKAPAISPAVEEVSVTNPLIIVCEGKKTTSRFFDGADVGLINTVDSKGRDMTAKVVSNLRGPQVQVRVCRTDEKGMQHTIGYEFSLGEIAGQLLDNLANTPIIRPIEEWQSAVIDGETELGYEAWAKSGD